MLERRKEMDKNKRDALRAQEEKFRAWLGIRTSYLLEEVPADCPPLTNEQRSAVEVYDFVNDPPQKYFAYVSEKTMTITTWMGNLLGKITRVGDTYRCLFGDTRRSIHVLGVNGLRYYGVYYQSSGDYCLLTANKR